jgi:dihydropteroate synthase
MTQPKIMGVINVTPDSFYASSRADGVDAAVALAHSMIDAGADILDIGGEATNPKRNVTVSQVSAEEEIDRVAPVIEAIAAITDVTLSVDTSKPEVMQAAVSAGATMVNDQRALKLTGALEMAASLNVDVCIMHMFGCSRTLGEEPKSDMFAAVKAFLLGRAQACMSAGIAQEHIILDPGFGTGNYGKDTPENLYMLSHFDELVALGYRTLVGVSRKTMIGEILHYAPPEERLYGSLGLAALAVMQGASVLRVHDVNETAQMVKVLSAAIEAY